MGSSSPPRMHLAPTASTGSVPSSSSNDAPTSSDSGTRVMTEEPGYYGGGNAPLTSSPGEVGPSAVPSAMRKSGPRQGTGQSQNITITEPPSTVKNRQATDVNNEDGHHGALSEKLHGLRHRPNKRGQSGHSTSGSGAGRPTPQRSLSTGPRGFLQRIATVRI